MSDELKSIWVFCASVATSLFSLSLHKYSMLSFLSTLDLRDTGPLLIFAAFIFPW